MAGVIELPLFLVIIHASSKEELAFVLGTDDLKFAPPQEIECNNALLG